MILTGEQIEKSVRNGEIVIDPFNKNQIGPNSYDFKLGDKCLVYKNIELDSAKDNEVIEITIPEDGLLLDPVGFPKLRPDKVRVNKALVC